MDFSLSKYKIIIKILKVVVYINWNKIFVVLLGQIGPAYITKDN